MVKNEIELPQSGAAVFTERLDSRWCVRVAKCRVGASSVRERKSLPGGKVTPVATGSDPDAEAFVVGAAVKSRGFLRVLAFLGRPR